MLGTATVMSDYLFVSSIQPLPPGADDYGLSVVIPVNHPRLRIYPRRPYGRDVTTASDYPLSAELDESDALVVFDDVDVPPEHVFVDRDRDITFAQFNQTPAHILGNVQAQIRYSVKLRFMAGLASVLAEWSGQNKDRGFQLGLGRLAAQVSVPHAMMLAAEYNARIDDHGVARPDPEMLYSAMTLQPWLYRDIVFAMREMTGGTTIQVPSSVKAWDDAVSRGRLGALRALARCRCGPPGGAAQADLGRSRLRVRQPALPVRDVLRRLRFGGAGPLVSQLRLGAGPCHGASLPG